MKLKEYIFGGSPMARWMKLAALAAAALTAVFALLRLEPLAITAGTFAYHLLMRLAVGFAFDRTLNNHVDVRHRWFRLHRFEAVLYDRLQVGKWKAALPTYDPDAFDRHQHSWEEIAQAMCQAELVHEVIALLSFLPVAASPWLGAMAVFIITSVLAAAFDLLFVIIQRYNRPRVMKIVERLKDRM